MKLTVKQTRALDLLEDGTTKEVSYGGGAGGGKSLLGCYWILKSAMKYSGTRWLVGRSVLKRMRETTFVTMLECLKLQGLKEGTHFTVHNSDFVIRLSNGSVILFKDLARVPSDPNYDYLGSLEISGAFVDEAVQIEARCKEVLMSRIRYKLDEFNIFPTALFTCNPARGWIYNQFYIPSRENRLPEKRAFVQSLATDNPHLPASYIEALNDLENSIKQRLLFGNWEFEDEDGQLFPYEQVVGAYSNNREPDTKARFISADIALQGSDKFVIAVWQGLKVLKIVSIDKCDPDEVVQVIKEIGNQYRVPKSNTIYDGDGIGQFLTGYLRGAVSFRNNAAPFHKENYSNLKSQCFFKLSEKLNKGELDFSLIEDRHRKDITNELTAIRNDSLGTDNRLQVTPKKDLKQILNRSPDYADAIMMRMYWESKKKSIMPPVLW